MPIHESRFSDHDPNCFCTSALRALPSTRPATFACNAFITAPICAREVAPASAIVSRTTFETSSALIGCGKYPFKIESSSFSFSTSSARPPFSKLSIESWRCFTCLRMTCAASASLNSASAPDFAIAAYFNADLSIRKTPSFVVSLARIASLRSESTRCCSVMRGNYVATASCRSEQSLQKNSRSEKPALGGEDACTLRKLPRNLKLLSHISHEVLLECD